MSDFKNILVIDSAMSGAGVGVITSDVEVARMNGAPRGQAEYLIPMVQDAIDEAGIGFEDLDGLISTVGPGAFTGLRTGLASAKSLAMALERPIFGVSTLQGLAMSVAEDARAADAFTVLVETRRDDFYMQSFGGGARALSEAQAMSAEEIEGVIDEGTCLVGDAVERFKTAASGCYKNVIELQGVDVLSVGRCFLNDSTLFSETVEPLYLRGADVSTSKKLYRKLVDT